MPVTRHLSAAAVSAFMICIVAIYGFSASTSATDMARVHKVAIAKLVWLTILFYTNSIALSVQGASGRVPPLAPVNDLLRGLDTAFSVAFLAAVVHRQSIP